MTAFLDRPPSTPRRPASPSIEAPSRPRPDGLATAAPGPIVFARFAFPPNRLGLCGPATGETLPDRVRDGRIDPELTRIAREFEGAWPYLELIAAENGLADPLDARVVEAYWLGNELLSRVGPRARHDDLTARFKPRARRTEWPWLEAKAGGASRVHHSFHVLEVLPRIGLIRGGLPADMVGALEHCLVRPARVVGMDEDELVLMAPPLELRDGRLGLGQPAPVRLARSAGQGYGDVLETGDDVAIHWDRVCGRLSGDQVARLLAVTARNIEVANETL